MRTTPLLTCLTVVALGAVALASPAPPATPAFTAAGFAGRITVRWPAEAAGGYGVYLYPAPGRASGGPWRQAVVADAAATAATLTVPPGVYGVRVYAYGPGGTSGSRYAEVSVPVPPPSPTTAPTSQASPATAPTTPATAPSTRPAPVPMTPTEQTSGQAPLAVWFDVRQAAPECDQHWSLRWDFGDEAGQFNEVGGFVAARLYRTPGDYTVRLCAFDASGALRTRGRPWCAWPPRRGERSSSPPGTRPGGSPRTRTSRSPRRAWSTPW